MALYSLQYCYVGHPRMLQCGAAHQERQLSRFRLSAAGLPSPAGQRGCAPQGCPAPQKHLPAGMALRLEIWVLNAPARQGGHNIPVASLLCPSLGLHCRHALQKHLPTGMAAKLGS